ncbi:MAG: capsule biosynthesis protein [Acidithiobacillus sp.]
MLKSLHHRLRGLSKMFWIVVILPTGLSILYFGIIASPVYISEARFVVYSPGQPVSSSSGLASLISGISGNYSSSASETIKSYISSWDAMMSLSHKMDLKGIYSRGVDFLDRYGGLFYPFQNEVRLWRYYQSMTDDTIDPSSGISILKVKAYSPQEAQAINRFLLAKGQDIVNQLNQGARDQAVRFAEVDVKQARRSLEDATVALTDYRNGQRVISPVAQSQLQLALASKLEDQIIQQQTQLNAIIAHAPQNPNIPVLRSSLQALQGQLNALKSQITGDQSSLASKDSGYETLKVNQEIAEKLLVAAVTSLQQARIAAQKKELYLETISSPNRPNAPQLPRRIEGIVATFLISLMIWGVLVVVVGGIKEHQER